MSARSHKEAMCLLDTSGRFGLKKGLSYGSGRALILKNFASRHLQKAEAAMRGFGSALATSTLDKGCFGDGGLPLSPILADVQNL